MKKLFVLGLVLSLSTGCGCGRSWFPRLFRGAPCNGLCSAPNVGHGACEHGVPMEHAGYGSYDNGVVQSSDVYGSEYVPATEFVQGGTITPNYTPMAPIPGPIVKP